MMLQNIACIRSQIFIMTRYLHIWLSIYLVKLNRHGAGQSVAVSKNLKVTSVGDLSAAVPVSKNDDAFSRLR